MNTEESGDPLFELLERLPADAPGRASENRVRAQCHAALARQRRHANVRRRTWAAFDAAAFGVIGLYLIAAIVTALHAGGLM